ncbi:DUF6894 family protein [Bradyrhizobium japonicum]
MAVFYVDLHGSDGELRDDEGIELHDLTSARRLATEALGQIIIEWLRRSVRTKVRQNPRRGEILRVSANVSVSAN